MRDKQHLGCLRVREGVLMLEQLYFADEIRPIDEIRARRAKVDAQELKMARQLIDAFAGSFEPERYKDTYRDALLQLIEAKRKGETIERGTTRSATEPDDRPDRGAAREHRGVQGEARRTRRRVARC